MIYLGGLLTPSMHIVIQILYSRIKRTAGLTDNTSCSLDWLNLEQLYMRTCFCNQQLFNNSFAECKDSCTSQILSAPTVLLLSFHIPHIHKDHSFRHIIVAPSELLLLSRHYMTRLNKSTPQPLWADCETTGDIVVRIKK